MFYQKIIPIKPLRNYIRYFWVLEDCGGKTFKIIPDGLTGLIFQENETRFVDKEHQILPQMFVYGQTTFHSEQHAVGNFRNIGVYLEPTALKSIFQIDAFELTNQHISIDSITNEHIVEELVNVGSIEKKIDIISQFFLKRIQQIENPNKKADFAITLLQNGKSLKDIQTEMKISERSLERIMKSYVGISPKAFSRIIRFQSGLQSLRHKDFEKLTDLAYKEEYFDQSHYIREFKTFTGMKPSQFLQQTNEQLENFPEWQV